MSKLKPDFIVECHGTRFYSIRGQNPRAVKWLQDNFYDWAFFDNALAVDKPDILRRLNKITEAGHTYEPYENAIG